MARILFVVNPAACGGQGSKSWNRFLNGWPHPPGAEDIRITERTGHATEIAAAASDYDIVAAVGGDGTAAEVINGIMLHDEPRPSLAVIPAGTGNDVARNLGIFTHNDAVAALKNETTRRFDLVRIDCEVNGRRNHRYAFLCCGVGFGTSTMDTIRPWMKRLLRPSGAYYLGCILGVLRYRPPQMTVKCNEKTYRGRTFMILVANAERAGGDSMCIAPGASVDDGTLNVSIVEARSKLKVLGMLPKMASGAFIDDDMVSYFPAKELHVDSDPPAFLEVDGDALGRTPATCTICPGAIQIITTP